MSNLTPKAAHEYLRNSDATFDWSHNYHVITAGCEGGDAKFYDVAVIWNRHVNASVSKGLRGIAILDAAGVD